MTKAKKKKAIWFEARRTGKNEYGAIWDYNGWTLSKHGKTGDAWMAVSEDRRTIFKSDNPRDLIDRIKEMTPRRGGNRVRLSTHHDSKELLVLSHPLLGKVADRIVGEYLGVSTICVYRWRTKHGIQGVRGSKVSDIENHPLLGQVPDRVIAEELGVSVPTVFRCRHKLGIGSTKPRIAKDVENHPLLGKVSDTKLANLLGCVPSTVLKARKRLGIKSYRETQKENQ